MELKELSVISAAVCSQVNQGSVAVICLISLIPCSRTTASPEKLVFGTHGRSREDQHHSSGNASQLQYFWVQLRTHWLRSLSANHRTSQMDPSQRLLLVCVIRISAIPTELPGRNLQMFFLFTFCPRMIPFLLSL